MRGRLIGSVIGLLLSLGYTALTLWVGGDAVVGRSAPADRPAVERLRPTRWSTPCWRAPPPLGAVYGYRVLLRLSRVLAIGLTAPAGHRHRRLRAAPSPQPRRTAAEYLLGGFWQTWLLAAVSAGLSGPIAFITLLGDYSRYISPRRHSSRKVFGATCLGLIAGLLVPQLFGTFTALAVGAGEDYAGPLVAGAPFWYLALLLLNASAGSVGNAGLMLYSMGLDLDAILPRATRTQATYVVAGLATTLRLRRPLPVGRAGRDDLVRAADDGRRHALGGDHRDRLRPLPRRVRPGVPPGLQPRHPRRACTGTGRAGTSGPPSPGRWARWSACWAWTPRSTRGRCSL